MLMSKGIYFFHLVQGLYKVWKTSYASNDDGFSRSFYRLWWLLEAASSYQERIIVCLGSFEKVMHSSWLFSFFGYYKRRFIREGFWYECCPSVLILNCFVELLKFCIDNFSAPYSFENYFFRVPI